MESQKKPDRRPQMTDASTFLGNAIKRSQGAAAMIRGAKENSGFTLVELLIALTLLAMLSLLLFGGLRFGTRSWQRSEADVSATDQIGIAQSFLRRALEAAYPARLLPDTAQAKIDFEGTSQGIRFLTPAPAALSVGGMGRFTLIADRRENEKVLSMISRFELARENSSSSAMDVRLLGGFDNAEFEYFGSDRPADPPTWRNSWTDHATLPELVRIRIKFSDGDRRSWPDLVVAPRLTVDANCLYDPVIRRCRGR